MRSNEFHGNYTKHYYNGSERICSRLGDRTFSLDCSASLTPQTQQRLGTRIMQVDQNFRVELLELVEAGDVPVEFPNVLNLITLLPAGSNANSHSHSNPTSDIFYYHTNHLGSTAFVTDANATVTQGFLYAPFGEITTEFNARFGNGIIPKYTFNAKELDEETGMYYYEARYMAPPTFISRDPLFEKYFWMSPYAYCANNPVKYVDPSGDSVINTHAKSYFEVKQWRENARAFYDQARGSGDKIEIKQARKNLRDANRTFRVEESNYLFAQNAIDNFKSKMPDEYAKLNSLRNQLGNSVDVDVAVAYSGGLNLYGSTHVTTGSDGDIRNGKITIKLYRDMIESDGTSSGMVFAHEGGHGFYEVTNSKTYYDYCRKQAAENDPVGNGHNPSNNPSGLMAKSWEEKYATKR